MHNKIKLFIILTSFLLFGCTQSDNIEEKNMKNPVKELNYDEQFLMELKKIHKKDEIDGTSLAIREVTRELEEIKNTKIKEQVLNIFEKSLEKIINGGGGSTFLEYEFFPEGPNQIILEKYLKDSTIKEIYQKVYPVYYEVNEQDLVIVNQEFNEDFKLDEFLNRYEIFIWLDDNNVEFEYLTNASSHFLVLSETGIIVDLTNETGVPSTFTIEDNNGHNIDPHVVLKDVDERLIEKTRQVSEEFEKEYNSEKDKENQIKEEKKAEGPRIGMTDKEIVDIFGKPNKINRTTTATSQREQWVYTNDKYLYFENGILTTIQD